MFLGTELQDKSDVVMLGCWELGTVFIKMCLSRIKTFPRTKTNRISLMWPSRSSRNQGKLYKGKAENHCDISRDRNAKSSQMWPC